MSQEWNTLLSERLLTAEQGVLGSMLIDEEVVGKVLMTVSEDDFQIQENRNIFRAIKELYGQGTSPDPILVNERLGGAYGKRMTELLEITPTAANAEKYAKMLRETSRLWRLQLIGDQLAQAADLDSCRELADRANMLLSERSGVRRMDMLQGWKDFFDRHDPKKHREFIRWGFADLDEHLHVDDGDMVVIGGSASAGKTALALQLAFHIAKKRRVGVFSYETGVGKLHDRTIACQALTSYRKIMSEKLENSDFQQVYDMRKQLTAPSLEFLETSGWTVSGIGSYAMARHYDVIVVDYLQKIPAAGRGQTLSEFERVSQVSNDLQQLGRCTGKVVIALSQLSRQGKGEKTPTMSSLRQSGQIEQDADVVMLLYRENNSKHRRILNIAKNKDGMAGIDITLNFDGDNQRFSMISSMPLPKKKPKEPDHQLIFHPVEESEPTPFDGEK